MNNLKKYLILALVLPAILLNQFSPQKAQASYNMDFIISDAQFTNYNSMTAAQINAFLVAKGSVFANYTIPKDASVPYPYAGGNWGTVLAQQSNGGTNFYGKTVAQLLYEECQSHHINPQVMLAILQKESSVIEQSSVSSTRKAWPMFYRFDETMASFGYSEATAKDIAINYGGVGQQIAYSTWNFRDKFDKWNNGTFGNWRAGMNIGGVTVSPQSIATRLLYTYTPHSWQSFLDVLSRWSWNVYEAKLMYQGPSTGVGSPGVALLPDQTFTAWVSFQNTGSAVWSNSGSTPVRLGVSSPIDHGSPFFGGKNLRGYLVQSTVPSGQIGTFKMKMKTPSKEGTYTEYFRPVAENVGWMAASVKWTFVVSRSAAAAQTSGRLIDKGPTSGPGSPGKVIRNGQSVTLTVRYLNTGKQTWFRDGRYPAHLGTYSPRGRKSVFLAARNTRGYLVESSVPPGKIGTFRINITAPLTDGKFTEGFRPLMEDVTWFGDSVAWTLYVK